MPDLYVYSTPATAHVTLTLDSGQRITGQPCTANGRSDAHRLTLPNGTPTQGSLLEVAADGYTPFSGRGITVHEGGNPPQFVFDDVHLTPVPVAPPTPEPPPGPDPNADPFAIIQGIYATGEYELVTKEGCGRFVEACGNALHAEHSAMWGFVAAEPPQNSWNHHRVDSLMLIAKAGHTDAGTYDIIHDSESPNATPSFNYKGIADPNLYLYPAPAVAGSASYGSH